MTHHENTDKKLFTITIDGLAYGGAGVGRRGGKVVFIPGAYPGDTVLARVEKDKKRHVEAGLVRVEKPGPVRTDPACPHAADCGGCPWMGLSYPAQLEWKSRIIEQLLARIGGIEITAAPAEPSPRELGYRTRVKMKADCGAGTARIGYYRPRSHDLVAVDSCPIASGEVNGALADVRKFLGAEGEAARGVYELEIFTGGCENEGAVVELRVKGEPPKGFLERLVKSSERIKGAAMRHGKNFSVEGDVAVETPTIEDKKLVYWPGVFSQVNADQNLTLVETVARLSGLLTGMSGLDLFCGMGNFALPLAMRGAAMTGVESSAEAVRAAEANRDRLGVLTASFSRAEAEEAARRMVENGLAFDTVIADPPRGGIYDLLDAVAALAKKRIVYVSCDPASLARDAKRLAQLGFPLKVVEPVDMFPQTSHIEAVALFERA
ncbi:MAG: class I SAM-dependent RNA methyltransferase [Candidatus Nitrospinota bacterium M3_3B_026]